MNKPRKPTKNCAPPSNTVKKRMALYWNDVNDVNELILPEIHPDESVTYNNIDINDGPFNRVDEYELTFSILKQAADILKINNFEIRMETDYDEYFCYWYILYEENRPIDVYKKELDLHNRRFEVYEEQMKKYDEWKKSEKIRKMNEKIENARKTLLTLESKNHEDHKRNVQ